MAVNVFKIELMVVDHDNIGADGVISELENTRYANRCISPSVMSIAGTAVEWDDEHPLNHHDKAVAAFNELFK